MAAGPQLVREWIRRAATQEPEKPWIFSAEDGRAVTYAELHKLAGKVAGFLRDHGIGPNDRVALLANNSIEHLACYIGVLAYGATICTIHVEMNRHYLDNILPALNPRVIVFQEGLALESLLSSASAPCLALGAWNDHGAGSSFYTAVNRCEPIDTVAEADE